MDTTINEVLFDRHELLQQFTDNGYIINNTILIDKFLLEDLTIDLEKLELVISLLVEFLENSENLTLPFYVFLGNMKEYFADRGIDPMNVEKVSEETAFILGFCQSIADDYVTIYGDVIVLYGDKNVKENG